MAREVDQFKQGFFDRGAVIAAIGKAAAAGMARTAGYVRKVARNSMKKKRGAAPKGQPPHVHEGSLKKLLFFAQDLRQASTVIGPVAFSGSKVPGILEFGSGKIAKHPYMRPAMEKAIPTMAQSIKFGG